MNPAKRLPELGSLIQRYAHRWGPNPSQRMLGWVDEYNDLKAAHPGAFAAYCKGRGICPTHDGYDCLA